MADGANGGLAIRLGTLGFFTRPDYHDVLRRLRAESPVHPTLDRMVALSRYDDVREVSRDPVRFVSGGGPDQRPAVQPRGFGSGGVLPSPPRSSPARRPPLGGQPGVHPAGGPPPRGGFRMVGEPTSTVSTLVNGARTLPVVLAG